MLMIFVSGLIVTQAKEKRETSGFWWMNPVWTVIIALAPGLALCALLPQSYFLEHWSTPKFITPEYLLLICGLGATFIVGTYLGYRTTHPVISRPSVEDVITPSVANRLMRITRLLFWITTLGYTLWALIGISRGLRPGDIAAIFTSGGIHTAKSFLRPVAGITTLTQFGPLTATCLMLLRRVNANIRTRRYIIALILLALVRTFLYAERLALIELGVPMFIVLLAFPKGNLRFRTALTLLPLWLPIAVLVFFGTFEYFRSYSSTYYRNKNAGHNYAYYTVTRLGGYYATALNNGVLLLHTDDRRSYVPFYSLEGFWKFPVLSSVLPYKRVAGTDVSEDFMAALETQANPAFNNPSGILLPVFDYGSFGAFVFWLIVGGTVGRIFALFRNRDIRGILLYPVIFIGLWEMGLILYWPTGRAFPSIIAALIISARLRIPQREKGAVTSNSEPGPSGASANPVLQS